MPDARTRGGAYAAAVVNLADLQAGVVRCAQVFVARLRSIDREGTMVPQATYRARSGCAVALTALSHASLAAVATAQSAPPLPPIHSTRDDGPLRGTGINSFGDGGTSAPLAGIWPGHETVSMWDFADA